MLEYDTISTETWKICLPRDWSEQKSSAEHTSYFESADQTKGAYFSTWCFQNDPRSAREILQSFQLVELRALREMKDHSWEKVDEWYADFQGGSALGMDFLDRKNSYRIVCYLICRLPWVVRSSFHDYNCIDYETSKQFFRPIIESLQIHNKDG